MTFDIKSKILEYLSDGKTVNGYQLAKVLNTTYNVLRWHLETLERQGLIESKRVGSRVYFRLKNGRDVWDVTVEDLIEEIRRRFRGLEKRKLSELSAEKAKLAAEIYRILFS